MMHGTTNIKFITVFRTACHVTYSELDISFSHTRVVFP